MGVDALGGRGEPTISDVVVGGAAPLAEVTTTIGLMGMPATRCGACKCVVVAVCCCGGLCGCRVCGVVGVRC